MAGTADGRRTPHFESRYHPGQSLECETAWQPRVAEKTAPARQGLGGRLVFGPGLPAYLPAFSLSSLAMTALGSVLNSFSHESQQI